MVRGKPDIGCADENHDHLQDPALKKILFTVNLIQLFICLKLSSARNMTIIEKTIRDYQGMLNKV